MSFAPLSVSDQLAIYAEIHTLYGVMVEAAQTNGWDNLIALESRVAALRDRLMHGEGNVAVVWSADESERKADLIRKILADDAEIRRHTEPWMENVRQFLGSQRQRQKVQQAYID